MEQVQFEELMQSTQEEKTLILIEVQSVVEDLVQNAETEENEIGEFNYLTSPRKKLRDIAKLFENNELRILGTSEDYHNAAVNYARQNLYDCACIILQRGLCAMPYSVDLLADLIRYRVSSGEHFLSKEPFCTLSHIEKERWNWRAFSFSIDYLLEEANLVESKKERNILKRKALLLADQFIQKEKSDQAYYDKAAVLNAFGSNSPNADSDVTEESVLRCGLEKVKVAPKCALRLADILFDRGDYAEAIEKLQRCCINAFKPQPDINGSYAFLLLGLSRASKLFDGENKSDYSNSEELVNLMYKDFHTAISNGLNGTFKKTADTAIKVIEAQTGFEYPYTDADTEDPYDF